MSAHSHVMRRLEGKYTDVNRCFSDYVFFPYLIQIFMEMMEPILRT